MFVDTVMSLVIERRIWCRTEFLGGGETWGVETKKGPVHPGLILFLPIG